MMEVQEERRCTIEVRPGGRDKPAQLVNRLAAAALDDLLVTLRAHGNKISTTHQRALRELLDDLAAQAVRLRAGRRAYALPCGTGKTLSVVALVSTSRSLGLPLTFAVATSQIAALGRLRRDLVRAGVRPEDIALRHSKTPTQLAELVADADDLELLEHLGDTASADRPILLLSHARVRSGAGDRVELWHRGAPRSLVIWDESLFVADADALTIQEVRSACDLVLPRLPPQSLARSYLASISNDIDDEVARQRLGAAPTPLALLPQVDNEQLASALAAIPSFGNAFVREASRTAKRLLRMSGFPLSVALTRAGASGEGLIRYSVAVPSDLTNIAILDASHQVRLLAQSHCITDGTTEAMRNCKRYDHVQVNEFSMSTGKSTLSDSHAHRDRLALQVARQVLLIPSDEPVLIFTSKGDESKSLQRQLKELVGQHGVNLGQLLDGKPRISWLTWGSETSLNSFSRCKHVILCGVVRRNPLELAASVAGREDDLLYRMSRDEQRRVQLSEMCHSVLQALSRGSCRISNEDGQANAMTLTIYGTFPGMREMLAPSLPGIRWHAERLAQSESRTGTAARRILEHLDSLPASKRAVSVSSLKKSMDLGVGRDALTTAVKDVAVLSSLPMRSGGRWRHEGRSLVRVE